MRYVYIVDNHDTGACEGVFSSLFKAVEAGITVIKEYDDRWWVDYEDKGGDCRDRDRPIGATLHTRDHRKVIRVTQWRVA